MIAMMPPAIAEMTVLMAEPIDEHTAPLSEVTEDVHVSGKINGFDRGSYAP